MVKKIVQIGDSKLLNQSEPVETQKINTGEMKKLIADLVDTCKFYYKQAAGLSAVQLGILKRVYVIKRVDLEVDKSKDDNNNWEAIINPEITYKSADQSIEWEGCMSINVGRNKLFGPVYRPKEVEIEYFTFEGEKKKLKGEKFFSHLIQHEQDHLDGILFLSYIKNPKNIWNEEELDQYLGEFKKFPEIIE
jgi:peptide deformylase